MKYIAMIAILLSSIASVSAESLPAPCPTCGAGGATKAWNYTTSKYELLPQCFPFVWASDYFVMNIASMYSNQESCRADRAFDFRF